MDNYTASVKQIIYRSFVKYDRLQPLIYETFSNSSISECTSLDIYIDLYSVLKPLFSEHSRTKIEEYTEVTTEIINMCAHYRYFFRKLSVATRFFLVWSYNTSEINRKFVSAAYNDQIMFSVGFGGENTMTGHYRRKNAFFITASGHVWVYDHSSNSGSGGMTYNDSGVSGMTADKYKRIG